MSMYADAGATRQSWDSSCMQRCFIDLASHASQTRADTLRDYSGTGYQLLLRQALHQQDSRIGWVGLPMSSAR